MKKVFARLLTMMFVFTILFTAVGSTASAASQDQKAKQICSKYSKAAKAGECVGKVKVTVKKQKGAYNFTFTLNMNTSAPLLQLTKMMSPKHYNETRDSFKKTSTKLRKDIKKQGIKKCNVTYVVKAKGTKVWVVKNGKLTYDKFK
jgi:predicted transcriptional regulator YheO